MTKVSGSVSDPFTSTNERLQCSAKSDCTDVERRQLEEFAILMEDRTFVDYFNVFLCLPVFGQHVFYNFFEKEFQFEPPIRRRRRYFLDYGQVLVWLFKERFHLFKTSPLYLEYILCQNLLKDCIDTEDNDKVFLRNTLGSVVGMLMFRESLRGICGENVYRCWKDLEAWHHLEDPVKKIYWKRLLKNKYINDNSQSKINKKVQLIVFSGILNFELVPDTEIQEKILTAMTNKVTVRKHLESEDEALTQLQLVLFSVMKTYWVPRFQLTTRKALSSETQKILSKPFGRDEEAVKRLREMRCKLTFPNLSDTNTLTSGSLTSLLESDLSSFGSDDEDELADDAVPISHNDLLTLWGGKQLNEVKNEPKVSSTASSCGSLVYEESAVSLDKGDFEKKGESAPMEVARSPCPILLTSYLGGKKRVLMGKFPSTSNRILWSLASDTLACHPFEKFLSANDQTLDLRYIGFWLDVRNYLDTDESQLDNLGHPVRSNLAHKLASKYLVSTDEDAEIFSESMKTSLLKALSRNNNIGLLILAQDIVLDALWEPLKYYIEEDRKEFLRQVRGLRYNLSLKKRNLLEQQERNIKSRSEDLNPIFFYQLNTTGEHSCPRTTPSVHNILPDVRPGSSRLMSQQVCISEEQMLKAMELNVLCSEYGISMMQPQHLPKPDFLVDILHSDFGSLTITKVATVRKEWLRNLIYPPKIDIENIRVSRKVILEKVHISKYMKEREAMHLRHRTHHRLNDRRAGIVIDRPPKPKSFSEVLNNSGHYEFFKRFMMMHKAALPITFWRAIEDLKGIANIKTKQIRVTQIMRKFFGRYTKYGAMLDCQEEIIRQLSRMEKVTSGILVCAQAAVFRTLERKWFPIYLQGYPTENSMETASQPEEVSPKGAPDIVTPDVPISTTPEKKRITRTRSKCRTAFHWEHVVHELLQCHRSLKSSTQASLFDSYLRWEIEKEQSIDMKQGFEKQLLQSSTAADIQARSVIKNRLVILNRLPSDLSFWIEAIKYQEQIDSVSTNNELRHDKAKSIIAMFIQSDIPPKLQINIPNDMALTISNTLVNSGAIRPLFHEAICLLFPIIYHYWRSFRDDWLYKEIPKEVVVNIRRRTSDRVSDDPHREVKAPIYTSIAIDQMKKLTVLSMDDQVHIIFSVLEGTKIIYPSHRYVRPSDGQNPGRRGRTSNTVLDHLVKKDSVLVKRESKSGFKTNDKLEEEPNSIQADKRSSKLKNSARSSLIDESAFLNMTRKLDGANEDRGLKGRKQRGNGKQKFGFDTLSDMNSMTDIIY